MVRTNLPWESQMSTRPIFNQQVGVLDVSGSAAVYVGIPPTENWSINAITVNVTAPITLEAQCRIYRNQIGPQFLVDSTISGSSGDTSDTIHDLKGGERLIAVWTGGDPGAVASITVRGTGDNPQNTNGGFRAVS